MSPMVSIGISLLQCAGKIGNYENGRLETMCSKHSRKAKVSNTPLVWLQFFREGNYTLDHCSCRLWPCPHYIPIILAMGAEMGNLPLAFRHFYPWSWLCCWGLIRAYATQLCWRADVHLNMMVATGERLSAESQHLCNSWFISNDAWQMWPSWEKW